MYDWRAEWQERFGRTEPKIICVGLNYKDHAVEGGVKNLPTSPILFAKFSTALCNDGDSILMPDGIGHVDSEAELAVVIGRECHKVSADDALDFVHGYTCGNDVSARDAQFGDRQWFRGKTYDTFCPVGPRIVPGGRARRRRRPARGPAPQRRDPAGRQHRASSSSACASWSRSRRTCSRCCPAT